MEYWRCSVNIHLSPIVREISTPTSRNDPSMLIRECIFMKLLSYSVNGYEFFDSKELATTIKAPPKQCEIVWDICMKRNVLQKHKTAFSALSWMIDSDLIAPREMPQTAPLRALSPEAYNHTPEAEEALCRQTSRNDEPIPEAEADLVPTDAEAEGVDDDNPQIVDSIASQIVEQPQAVTKQIVEAPQKRQGYLFKEIKEAVRPNVFMTRSEIGELMSKYSAEQICLMLDKLSEYKSQNRRFYASDFQAIQRWVVKWLNESSRIVIPKTETVNTVNNEKDDGEFPSWLTGK